MPCTLKAAKGWIYRYNLYTVFRRGALNFASADCKGAGGGSERKSGERR